MTTNFRVNGTDVDDLLVRRDLFSEGGLWGWGYNGFGELGNSTVVNRSSPVQVTGGGTNWKQVGVMGGIKTDGTLWVWGYNGTGQLATNDTANRSSPVQTVSAGNNWKQIGYACAIKTDGTLWLWGDNTNGRIGDNTVVHRSSPVQTIASGTTWRQVSSSDNFTGAIKTDGTLWMWGANNLGQLGTGDTTKRSSPVQTISGGTNWKQISCGNNHAAAIKTDGSLWLWGYNIAGQLGDNTSGAAALKSSPVQTISGGTNWKSVAAGLGATTAAIKTDGSLWLWGDNPSGQLGTNDTTNRSSPVQTVSAGKNWKSVYGLNLGSTVAIKTDGTLWVWGDNSVGQLGDNTVISKSSPVQTVSGGTNWKQVSGYSYVLAIRDNYWS